MGTKWQRRPRGICAHTGKKAHQWTGVWVMEGNHLRTDFLSMLHIHLAAHRKNREKAASKNVQRNKTRKRGSKCSQDSKSHKMPYWPSLLMLQHGQHDYLEVQITGCPSSAFRSDLGQVWEHWQDCSVHRCKKGSQTQGQSTGILADISQKANICF